MNERDLDRLWQASSASAPPLDARLEAEIAERMAADLKPVRPLPSAEYFTLGFLVVVAFLAVLGAWVGGAHALGRMSSVKELLTFAALSLSVSLIASALASQMVPAARSVAPALTIAAAILVGLFVLFAVLFPMRHENHFWRHASLCFRGGLEACAIAAIPCWLLLRRGAILDPRACGALAGLLGGLAGTTILEMDCSDFNLAHILLAHWGPALFCAAAGWAIGSLPALFRRSKR